MVGRRTKIHTQDYSFPTHSPPLHTHTHNYTHTHITQSCNQFSTCRLQWQLLYLLSAALQFSIKMFAQKTPFETAVPRAGRGGKVSQTALATGICIQGERKIQGKRATLSVYVLASAIPNNFFKIFSIVKFVCLPLLFLLLLPLLLYYIFLLA